LTRARAKGKTAVETFGFDYAQTPIGTLTLVASEAGLTHVFLPERGRGRSEGSLRKALAGCALIHDPIRLAETAHQIEEYFDGKRTAFSVDLDLRGTSFQKRVWRELVRVPYGSTETYGKIARRIGRPGAARAVGAACGANPAAVIVPCHRIVGADGSLTGFGGGLKMKENLLALEKRMELGWNG
jgi:methylated-DNA-[protein]-cysteine S-methyltransferase